MRIARPADSARKGPVAVLSRRLPLSARLVALLEAERFDVVVTASMVPLLGVLSEQAPTVVILDWASDDEPSVAEVIHQLRVRPERPRIVVLADGPEADELRRSPSVRAVVGAALEVEELVDAVWRVHHETVDARQPRSAAGAADPDVSPEGRDGSIDR